jgi:tripartite-type tricarboxylate transporter receptor subunit TctC
LLARSAQAGQAASQHAGLHFIRLVQGELEMKLATQALLAAVLLHSWSVPASAQQYPSRAVRVIVPYPPGGGADFTTRVFSKVLGEKLGQQFVVDNRPGANGNIGAELAAKSQPNGYTLLGAANTTVTVNPALYAQMPVDMLRELAPVSIMASQPNVLIVHPSLPAKTVKDLVSMAATQPGRLDYASAGAGSSSHIAAELFRMVARIDITHVPYKGNGPAMADLLGGQIPIMFNNLAPAMPQVRSGKLRALAVTGEQRSAAAPDVPTMAEAGYPGVLFMLWVGMLAPSGTPADVVARLNAEIVRAAQLKETSERLLGEGAEPYTTSPARMADIMRDETAKWAQVVKAAKIAPQ